MKKSDYKITFYTWVTHGDVVRDHGNNWVDIPGRAHLYYDPLKDWLNSQKIAYTIAGAVTGTRLVFENNADRDLFLLHWVGVKHNGYQYNS